MRTSAASGRLGSAAIVVAGLLLGTAGCAPSPAFATPIRWSEGTRLIYGEEEATLPAGVAAVTQLVIELDAAGRGRVEGLPHGALSERPDGTICLEAADGPLYSGDVTWSARGDWGIDLAFDGGAVLAQSGPGHLAEDWSELRIFPCGVERAYWRVGIACGSLGSPSDERLGLRPCEDPG